MWPWYTFLVPVRSSPARLRKHAAFQGSLTESASRRDLHRGHQCGRDAVHASSATTITALIQFLCMILTVHVLVTGCGHSVQAFVSGSHLFALLALDVLHRRFHVIFSTVDAVPRSSSSRCRNQFCSCFSDNTISSIMEMFLRAAFFPTPPLPPPQLGWCCFLGGGRERASCRFPGYLSNKIKH